MRHFIPLLAALLLALCASTVSAETAVLLPVKESAVNPGFRKPAYDAVQESLTASNLKVISSEEAQASLKTSRLCSDLDCASPVLTAVGGDMLVAIALEPAETNGYVREVLVMLVDNENRYVNGSATVESLDVATAARAAFQRAFAKWPARGGVPLRVEGEPSGATVSIDGHAVGVLPLEKLVTPGLHRIVVNHSGYSAWVQDVSVSVQPNSPTVVTATLDRDPNASTKTRTGPRWHIIGGTALMATGAAMITGALVRASKHKCERTAPDGACVESSAVQPAALGVWVTAGSLSFVGGLSWLWVGQHRARTQGSESLEVGFGPSTLVLKGGF